MVSLKETEEVPTLELRITAEDQEVTDDGLTAMCPGPDCAQQDSDCHVHALRVAVAILRHLSGWITWTSFWTFLRLPPGRASRSPSSRWLS